MTKMKKGSARLLSLLLTLAMVFSLLPTVAFAAGETVTFDARNGETITPADIADGAITLPADPTWTGYTFAGWFTGIDGAGTEVTGETTGLSDGTAVYAKWTKGGVTVRTEALDLTQAVTPAPDQGWTWDDTSKVLTLNNAIFDLTHTEMAVVGDGEDNTVGKYLTNYGYALQLTDGATVTLENTNTIIGPQVSSNRVPADPADDSYGKSSAEGYGVYIPVGASCTINGSGSLDVTGGKAIFEEIDVSADMEFDTSSVGIGGAKGTVTVESGTINAKGGSQVNGAVPTENDDGDTVARLFDSNGGIAIGIFNLNAGTVTGETGTGTVALAAGISMLQATLTGGELTGVCRADGAKTKVAISGIVSAPVGGTVTGSATADGEMSEAIYDNSARTWKVGDAPAMRLNVAFVPAVPTVTFDARNGVEIPPVETVGGKVTLPTPAPEWTGYTFAGWYTNLDYTGDPVTADTSYATSTTVYAKWMKDGVTVRTTPLDLTTLTEDASGSGWTWDHATTTLTLNGAIFDLTHTEMAEPNDYSASIMCDRGYALKTAADTTLMLKGTSTLIGPRVVGRQQPEPNQFKRFEAKSFGVLIPEGKTTVEGDGELYAQGGHATLQKITSYQTSTACSAGIYVDGSLKMQSGTVEAVGGTQQNLTYANGTENYGIYASSYTQNGGTVIGKTSTDTGLGYAVGAQVGSAQAIYGGKLTGTCYATVIQNGTACGVFVDRYSSTQLLDATITGSATADGALGAVTFDEAGKKTWLVDGKPAATLNIIFLPTITMGNQSGTVTYDTAGSATFSVTSKHFGTNGNPAYAPVLQWKIGDTWGTTTPTGVTATLNAAGDTVTVTTAKDTNAGGYKFKVVSGEYASAETTFAVKKANYTGTLSSTMTQRIGQAGITNGTVTAANFTSLAGAKITAINGSSTNVLSAVPTLADGTISYTTDNVSSVTSDMYTVTISTTNYNDITAYLYFKAVDKTTVTIGGTVAIEGLTEGKITYTGNPVTQTGTPSASTDGGTVIIDEYVYTYTGTGSTTYNSTTPPTAAGTYQLVVSVPDTNADYTGSSTPIAFEITKKSVTKPTADNTVFTYTGSEQTYAVATSDDYTVTGNKATNAGTTTVTVALTDKSNTQWAVSNDTTDVTFSFVIGKAVVTEPTIPSKVYTGETLTAEVPAGDRWSVTANAGGIGSSSTETEYDVVLTLTDSSNYKWSTVDTPTVTLKFKIVNKTLVTIGGDVAMEGLTEGKITYTGNPVTQTGTPTASTNDEDVTIAEYVYTYTSTDGKGYNSTTPPTAAGTYQLVVSVPNTNANYTGSSDPIAFEITKKSVTKPTADNTVFTYTGSEQTYAVATSGDYTVTGNKATNAGTTTVTVALTDKANTQWADSNDTTDVTFSFVIGKAVVTKPTILSKVYTGETLTADVPTDARWTVTTNAGGIGSPDEETEYDVVLTLTDSTNYKWSTTDAATVTLKFKIVNKTLVTIGGDVAIEGLTEGKITYTGSAMTYTGTPSADGVSAEDFTYTWQKKNGNVYENIPSNVAPTNAGDYKLVIAIDSDNADLMGSKEILFTIDKKDVTVSVKDVGISTGGTLPAFELACTGLIGNDTITITPTPVFSCMKDGVAVDGKTAGTYDIVWSNRDDATVTGDENYNVILPAVDAAKGTLTVTTPSSGGGSSTPPSSGIIVDGKTENIGTTSTKNGTTTVTLDEKKLGDKLTTSKDGGSVVIPVSGTANSAAAQLTGKSVEDMAKKDMTLTVQAKGVTYEMPAVAVDTAGVMAALGATDASKVPFTVTVTQEKNMKVEDATVIGTPVSFTVTATYNGKSVTVDRFGAMVARSIEITKEQAGKITTAVVVENGKIIRHVPTDVYELNGKFYAKINSMTNSTYTLIENESVFTDVAGKWYAAAADELSAREVTKNVFGTAFEGEKNITRAEFAAMLVNALGLPTVENATFDDVASDAWYSKAVATASQYGIVKGVGRNKFAPDATITRQEAMVMMARASEVAGWAGNPHTAEGFTDLDQVATWAADGVAFNTANGLIIGTQGKLNPNDTITRGETATVVLRLLQKAELVDVRSKV